MAIPLRLDFDAPGLRAIAKQTKAAGQARRRLALAAIHDGASRSEAAAIGSVTLQIVRDWVLKFNADGPAGLIGRSPPGQPARLNAAQRAALAQVIEDGPIPAARLETIAQARGIGVDAIEIWFADEARIGQKNKITRRWARLGSRPSAPRDQRTASTYIFGAICPLDGKAAGLILPCCNTRAMNLHLAEISAQVAPGKHAVLMMDQAGWHMSAKLIVPANITILPLPPKCPELNPVENVWQFMRDNWLSNRVFTCYKNIVDHCCDAWNKLADQPWRIMTLGLRDWAHGF